MTTLDDLAQWSNTASIDVLKLDVEGFELPALRGAKSLLTAGRIKSR
jgi:FkbM family methyltransferase